jgi:hypothetical protein
MFQDSVATQVLREISSWPNVTTESHRGAIVFFRVGRREIGHLHGNRMADLPFPVRIRERLVAEGKADLHYLHPQTGWVSYHIRGEEDLEPILQLFRMNYARPWLDRS